MALPNSIDLSSALASIKLKPLKSIPANATDAQKAKINAQNDKIAARNEATAVKAVKSISSKIEQFEARVNEGKSATLKLGKGFAPVKFNPKDGGTPAGSEPFQLGLTLGGQKVTLEALESFSAADLLETIANDGVPQEDSGPTPPAPVDPAPAPPAPVVPVTPAPAAPEQEQAPVSALTPVNGTRANPVTTATAGNDILDGTVGGFNAPVTYSAAGGDDEFVINTNVRSNPANLVIQGFGPGDKLVFGVANSAGDISQLNSLYQVGDNGSNITLTANSDGVVQTIQLANINVSRAGAGGAVDNISELAALLGIAAVEIFADQTATAPTNGSLNNLATNTTPANDIVDATRSTVNGGRITYDAGQGNDQFVIDANVANNPSNVDIVNFAMGDQLLFDVADPTAGFSELSAYSVADDRTNVTLIANANGSIQRIQLVGLVSDRASTGIGTSIDSVSELATFLGPNAVVLI